MKVYLATSFHDKELAKHIAMVLEAAGHTITYPWWYSQAQSVQEAEKDLRAIQECDVVLGIFEKPFIYKGAIFELGVAYSLCKEIIIIGNELDSMVFMLLENVTKMKSIHQVIKHLNKKIKQDEPV